MTETESMQLITSMINKAKNRFNESGILYLLWGWLILICCIVQFVPSIFLNRKRVLCMVFNLVGVDLPGIFICEKKEEREGENVHDEINQFVWIVFFIMYDASYFYIT